MLSTFWWTDQFQCVWWDHVAQDCLWWWLLISFCHVTPHVISEHKFCHQALLIMPHWSWNYLGLHLSFYNLLNGHGHHGILHSHHHQNLWKLHCGHHNSLWKDNCSSSVLSAHSCNISCHQLWYVLTSRLGVSSGLWVAPLLFNFLENHWRSHIFHLTPAHFKTVVFAFLLLSPNRSRKVTEMKRGTRQCFGS